MSQNSEKPAESPAQAEAKGSDLIEIKKEQGYFQSADGTRLYFEFDVHPQPRAALYVVHGYGDHLGRYAEFTAHFTQRGISVFRFDYRGHGHAEGRRGHIYAFEEYLQDFEAFRALADAQSADLPRFVCAHSNGGLIATHALAERAEGIAGLCLSSPFFGIAVPVPAWKSFAGRTLSRLVPAFSMPTGIDPALVSHDPEVIRGYADDPLVGKMATARWLTEILKAHAAAPAQAARLTLPVLHQQAGDDRIADAAASRRIFEQIASAEKQWIDYPGLYHEIWFETERARTVGDLTRWLEARLGPEAPSEPAAQPAD